MLNSHLLERAIEIALSAHKDLADRVDQPYFYHAFRVMNMGNTIDEKICGILHDVVEDTDWTFEQLAAEGFPENIIDALKCVTKIDRNEDYDAFIHRVSTNKLAINVKINDLSDNLDMKRLSEISERDLRWINKYIKAYHYLMNV